MLVTDGRFLSAGSGQLHQDLEGVDGHRPNLLQEVVDGLNVRILTDKNKNKLVSSKVTTKKVMKFFL